MAAADELHEALVRDIRAAGDAWREPVHRALRAVHRRHHRPDFTDPVPTSQKAGAL